MSSLPQRTDIKLASLNTRTDSTRNRPFGHRRRDRQDQKPQTDHRKHSKKSERTRISVRKRVDILIGKSREALYCILSYTGEHDRS